MSIVLSSGLSIVYRHFNMIVLSRWSDILIHRRLISDSGSKNDKLL